MMGRVYHAPPDASTGRGKATRGPLGLHSGITGVPLIGGAREGGAAGAGVSRPPRAPSAAEGWASRHMGRTADRWSGAWRAVRLARVAAVSVVAGLLLGGGAIVAIELTMPPRVAPPDQLLAAIVEAAPTSWTRAALVSMIRPALVEALISEDPATREGAAQLMAQVPSGVVVLDVETALARRAVERAAALVATRPAEAGERLCAQLARAWLPAQARRAASDALWDLLRRRAHRLTAERALRWLEIAVRHGPPATLRGPVAMLVIGRVARGGFLPGPDGLPTAGEAIAPLLPALRPALDARSIAALERVVEPASGHGPAELLISQLDAIAVDPGTTEELRRDLAAAATVVQTLVELRALANPERALSQVEPLVDTWPADPTLARLYALLLRRVGRREDALAALSTWLGPRGDTEPMLRLDAARHLRRSGRLDEATTVMAGEDVEGRLARMASLHEEATAAAAAGWVHQADRLTAEAHPLREVVPWALEALRLDLALADLRPSRAEAHAQHATPIAEALLAAVEAGEDVELDAVAHCTLAEVFDRAGDERRAAALLQEAGATDDADALDTVGRCMWRLGFKESARATLDRAFDAAPSPDHRARVAFHRFTAAGGLEDALAWASKAEDLGATAAAGPLLEAQAQLYSRRGQLYDACEILDVLLDQTDLDAQDAASLVEVASYLRSRWDCRGDVADLERSVDLLRQAVALDDDVIPLANLADVLAHLGIVRVMGARLQVDKLVPASTSPDFLELAGLGVPRADVLAEARATPELTEATALYEVLARRAPGETDALGWLSRWYEAMGEGPALSRLWAELPTGLDEAPTPCAVDPECVMGLRDTWKRARAVMKRAAFADPPTRAAAAILLAAAARDVAVVGDAKPPPLAQAERELKAVETRGSWPEVAVARAHVLIAQVAEERRQGAAIPANWLLLPEVDRLRALGGGRDDPRVAEAVALVLRAEEQGATPSRADASLVGLLDPEAAARLRARWAARPGVLEGRQLAHAMAPADPATVMGLASALDGRGSTETAESIRAEARELGVPLPP